MVIVKKIFSKKCAKRNPDLNNSIYLQRSPNLENPIENEPEEENFQFIVPNKFFFY
jgi:hypothetical protein